MTRRRLIPRLGLATLLVLLPVLLVPGPDRVAAQEIPRFRIKEERARDFFQKGLVFHNSMQYVAAREFFHKSLNVQPFFHLALRYLGDAYYYSGDWNEALEQWESLDSISDGAYPLVRQRGELLRFYLNRYRNPGDFVFLRQYYPHSWNSHSFQRPVDTAVDENNRLYLLSYESGNILQINPSGLPEREITGVFYDALRGPMSMAADDGRLYIADYSGDRVRVFTLNGYELADFGGSGSGDGQFRGPAGIAISKDFIYVTDSGNKRVQKFDREGQFLISFGGDERGRNLVFPAGVAVHADGTVYVADRDDRRILRYDRDGNFLGDIRSELLRKPRGLHLRNDRLVVADEEAGVLFYQLRENRWETLPDLRDEQDRPVVLDRPFSARLDDYGALHVADYGKNTVLTLVPRGLRIANMDTRIQRVDTRSFPTVGVFLTVKNRLGDPVRGLSRPDFALYENDRRIGGIRTDNMRPYNRRVNLVLVQESSLYFAEQFAPYLPTTLRGLLDPLRLTDNLRIVHAGDAVRNVYEGLERRRILQLLQEGDRSTEPNLGKGLFEALTILVPELGPRSVVLILSGKAFAGAYDQYTLQKIIQYARANEIAVHVISYEAESLGENADGGSAERWKAMHRELAERTGGTYYRGFDETALSGVYEAVRENLDERYIITYRSALSRELSGRYVDVRLQTNYLGTYGVADAGFFVPE